MINKTFLTEQKPIDIFDLDYSNDEEICPYEPYEACEIPRFSIDAKRYIGEDTFIQYSANPVLTETNESVDETIVNNLGCVGQSSHVIPSIWGDAIDRERQAVGRAIAHQIKEQDTEKYNEWSNDRSRFK